MARVLERSCRASDLTARLGGDEFIFLAVGKMAEKYLRARIALEVGAVNDRGGRPWRLAVSLAFSPLEPGSDLAGAIAQADAEMYKRKKARKGA